MTNNAEKILEYVFNNGPNALIIIDRKGVVRGFNNLAREWIEKVYATTLHENIHISAAVDQEEHSEFRLAFEDFENGKVPAPIVNIIRRGDEEFWYEINFVPIGEDYDELLLSISDITIRKQTFDILSENERRFKALMLHSPGITAVIDGDGTIVFMSESVHTFLDYKVSECRKRNIRIFMHGNDIAAFDRLLSHLKQTDHLSVSSEIQFINRNGQYLYFDVKGSNQLSNPAVHGIILNMHDITDRKQTDEMLRRIAHNNELILETVREGIFGVNTRNTISFINPYASDMLGYDESELIGKSIALFAGENSPLNPALDSTVAVPSSETEFVARNGRTFPVEFSVAPIIDKNVRSGNVVTFNDISHRKQIERDLITARDEAESANNAKSEFLAVMSHEIRTPMNSILGFLELMTLSSLDSTQREYLSIVISNAQNLIAIINDILDISKIEKGKLELDKIPFDPVAEISLIVKMFRAKAQERNVVIHFDHDEVPICLGDPLRFGQIVTNLAGNAIKFTPESGIITISLRYELQDNCVLLRVEVSDTGIGIPQESINSIFESFNQGDRSIAR
ncbi:MAG TPA: PAS domain S-box protein, partial [Spirochaetota bacterium]